MVYGFRLQAEYESGYIHTENDQDLSPYQPGRNCYFDIVNHMPTKMGHGRLVRFSLIGAAERLDIDWTTVPDDAMPIHYMEMERSIVMMGDPEGVDTGPRCLRRCFGFSYTDPETGETVNRVEMVEHT